MNLGGPFATRVRSRDADIVLSFKHVDGCLRRTETCGVHDLGKRVANVPSYRGCSVAALYNGQRSHMERTNLSPLGAVTDEVVKPIRDSIEVKFYGGGLVKSFERKAA